MTDAWQPESAVNLAGILMEMNSCDRTGAPVTSAIQGVIGVHASNNGVENDLCNEVIDRKLKHKMPAKAKQTTQLIFVVWIAQFDKLSSLTFNPLLLHIS